MSSLEESILCEIIVDFFFSLDKKMCMSLKLYHCDFIQYKPKYNSNTH